MSSEETPAISDESLEGIVRWYSLAKGYGFLSFEGDDRDVFVHHSLVGEQTLVEGERVRFQMVDGPKGLQATRLTRLHGRESS